MRILTLEQLAALHSNPESDEYKPPIVPLSDIHATEMAQIEEDSRGQIRTSTKAEIDISQIILSKEISDDVAVEFAIQAEARTTSQLVQQLIAMRIKHLNLPDAREILFPTSHLIERNIQPREYEDRFLAKLQEHLVSSTARDTKRKVGIALGDMATFYAAGWFNNRKVRRSMSDTEIYSYARAQAMMGYQEAHMASTEPGAKQSIEKIIDHFGSVVRILFSIKKTCERKSSKTVD